MLEYYEERGVLKDGFYGRYEYKVNYPSRSLRI